MNFVRDLEECLRDLAAASRSRHPGVKEASERAVLKLRTLQAGYVAQVRQCAKATSSSSEQHPTTAIFRSSDLLHPFLLAANYPNADFKLLEISFRAMRLLMEADAIVPSDGLHMVRVYQIQAQVVTAYYQKLYAKEIQQLKQILLQQQQQQQVSEDEASEKTSTTEAAINTANNTSSDAAAAAAAAAPTSSYSSWFNWGSSNSQAANAATTTTGTEDQHSATTKTTLKNAVSSSTGQTGNQHTFSPAHAEKLALEILSSLLQLMELLRHHPETLSNNVELWTNAVALACGWFFLPNRQHTVRQAAHSTVSQIISLLFVVLNNNNKLMAATWDDLLVLTESSNSNNNNGTNLQGAFRLCSRHHKNSGSNPGSTPPSPDFSLELMTQLWKEKFRGGGSQFNPCDQLVLKTMGVTMNLLQQSLHKTTGVEKALRVTQWTLTLIQSHAATHPNECRELLGKWLPPITVATEACRQHHDFEDGYVYNPYQQFHHHSGNTAGSESYSLDSTYNDFPSKATTMTSTTTTPTITNRRRANSSTAATALSSSTTTSTTATIMIVFPEVSLWKAALVLEAWYILLDDGNTDSAAARAVVLGDSSLTQGLAEALSDFATIGTSCRAHIEQVVEFGRRNFENSSSINSSIKVYANTYTKPTVFRKAEAALASGWKADSTAAASVVGSTKHLRSLSAHPKILGESMWLALQGILRLCECTTNAESADERTLMLRQIFAPALAVLQHFLKRFSGCDELVRLSLHGYLLLADTCMPLVEANNINDNNSLAARAPCFVERKVLLTSLSKLSLPSWGKHDATSLLQDHHVRILLCLLRIVHRHFDAIADEWEIILWTMEELSVLEVASPLLSDEAYHASLAVSAAYERFPGFSTCFSDASLTRFTETLTEITTAIMAKRDVVGGTTIVTDNIASTTPSAIRASTSMMQRSGGVERSSSNGESGGDYYFDGDSTSITGGSSDSAGHERTGFSGKIMHMGVRALYGGTGGEDDEDGNNHGPWRDDRPPRRERVRKAYYHDYRQNFTQRIAASSNSARMTTIGRLPFSLMLLSDVAMSNAFRPKECGDSIMAQFSRLAATSPVTRPFVMDMMTMLLLSRLSAGTNMALAFEGRGKLVFSNPMQSQLLAVESAVDESGKSRAKEQWSFSQAEALAPVCETMLNSDQVDVAMSSLEVLTTVLEGTGQTLHGEVWSNVIDAIASLSGNSSYRIDRTSSAWSSCCLMAFGTLKLIVDDFLAELPTYSGGEVGSLSSDTAHVSLLDCCSAFVGSRHDINTSLTAIGLLWTIADNHGSGDSTATDRALSELALLSSDDRPEVRNAAVNTLFSCISGRGNGFSPAYWQSCIQSTVFGVYDIVAAKAGARAVVSANEDETTVAKTSKNTQSRYTVQSHHSRDSAMKMWVATQVLVLRGLIRVLRNFFTPLLDTAEDSDWFSAAWEKILGFAFDAASQGSGRETLDIRSVGFELLVVCCQLASKAGIKAAVTQARVSTTMEVVNGALRSVRDSQPPSKPVVARTHSQITDISRTKLFLEAFASLEAFDNEVLKARKAEDDTDLQILNKLCGNLSLLHDCCRQDEFKVDNAQRSLEALHRSSSNEFDAREAKQSTDPETRFVQIVVSVLDASGGDPHARYLNQGQRGAIDLLRSIAGWGSSVAFEHLVRIAGSSFFIRKESDGTDNSDHFDHDCSVKQHVSLLNFEAAAAVSQEISNDNACSEVRAYVLYLVLAELESDASTSRRRYYKHVVPIMQKGIQSTYVLAARQDNQASVVAVEMVWTRILACLAQMLTPIPLGKDTFKISRVTEILSIVSCASANVPGAYASRLCAILSHGAIQAFEASKQHAVNAEVNPESELGRKSKRHRDDLLKLFFCCFSGSCSLQPDNPTLLSTAEAVFHGARMESEHSMKQLCVEASLFVCQAIQENANAETLVVQIFSSLCQIVVAVDSGALRDAAGKILTSFPIGEMIQVAQTNREEAETRAAAAEQRVAKLESEIALLKNERQLKKQDSRMSLWGLS